MDTLRMHDGYSEEEGGLLWEESGWEVELRVKNILDSWK